MRPSRLALAALARSFRASQAAGSMVFLKHRRAAGEMFSMKNSKGRLLEFLAGNMSPPFL